MSGLPWWFVLLCWIALFAAACVWSWCEEQHEIRIGRDEEE